MVKAFFRWAVDWELLEKCPTDGVKTPKVPKLGKPFVRPKGFQALLDICPPNRFMGARRRAMLRMFST